MNLSSFLLNKNLRNQWIQEGKLRAYVRKSVRLLDSKSPTATPCLDIGSVEVDENHRGKNIFKQFLSKFELKAKKLNRAIYIESILNPRLTKFLLSNGYSFVPRYSDLSPSMFKIFT